MEHPEIDTRRYPIMAAKPLKKRFSSSISAKTDGQRLLDVVVVAVVVVRWTSKTSNELFAADIAYHRVVAKGNLETREQSETNLECTVH
ncbi:unnamed protein product [Heligmosomoides polygyrus]|uniref:RNase III domain-containing protein n=1 Tax=Heligmosomoides polygyrus TaxID=6339 RepID=A0A183GFZ3_HELPZ|nr:unnamed protein product [Heligmosomoides polygyrus]